MTQSATEGQRRDEAVRDVLHDQPLPPPPLRPADRERGPRLSLVSIDVMRALAALAVLIYHIDVLFVPHPQSAAGAAVSGAINYGWLGVPLFFVISGFCIHLPYALMPRISPREYAIRRLVRIWPPYAAVLVVGAMAAIIQGTGSWKLIPQLGTHLAFLLIGRSPIREDNVVLWSIVVEVQLYFIYLAIRVWSPRWMTLLHWTLVFFAFGVAYHLYVFYNPLPDAIGRIANPRFFAPARMGDWLCGALIADVLVRHAQRPVISELPRALSRASRSVLFIVAGVAVIAASRAMTNYLELEVRRPDYHGKYTLEPFDALGFALIVAGFVFIEQRARAGERVAAQPSWLLSALVVAGQRCYSLYLFHYPILIWVSATAMAYTLVPGMVRLDLGTSARGWGVILVAVAVVIVATELAYRLIEKPSHALARRWGKSAVTTG